MLACSLRTKQCGILILLLCSLPVSGALWAAKYLRGVVGRAITINCHYEAKYHSHTKYWCHGWSRQCSVLVEINGQHRRRERASITDNLARGIFTVTMENLHSGDTGWYSCGITTPGLDPMFHVHLQVSDEPVSVPVLGFLSPSNISCVGGSVSVSCESVQGSLPIQYTWYEKTPSVDSKVSDTSKLDLHCQFFIHQRHQYYCTASNNHGEKPSEMVNVAVFNNTWNCSYVVQFSQTGKWWIQKLFAVIHWVRQGDYLLLDVVELHGHTWKIRHHHPVRLYACGVWKVFGGWKTSLFPQGPHPPPPPPPPPAPPPLRPALVAVVFMCHIELGCRLRCFGLRETRLTKLALFRHS